MRTRQRHHRRADPRRKLHPIELMAHGGHPFDFLDHGEQGFGASADEALET